MAKLGISTGTIPNDNTGDSLIVGAIKINSNFDEIYTYFGAGSTDVLSTPIWTRTSVGISTLRNVGVGTTNPTSALTVSGNAVITGVITASVFSGSISNAIYSQNSGVSTYSSISGVSTSSTKVSIGETNLGSNSIVLTSGATLGINSLYIDSGLTYNAATNTLTASTFSGNSTYAVNAGIATNVIGGIASITSLNVTGVSTFTNGPVLVGSGTSSGTASQPLQVTGGVYVSGNIGVGATNPRFNLEVGPVGSSGTSLWVNGNARITGILTVGTSSITLNGSDNTIFASSFIGTSTDSEKLSNQDPCFYTNYNNFYNTPEQVWTNVNQGGVGTGITITGISTTYTFSTSRTVAGVSTNRLSVRGHLYYPTSSNIGPEVDVVVLYHGTIETAGVSPLDAAQTFINIATNASQLNIRDKIVFSVAYPQDAVPVWVNNVENPAAEFPEFGTFLDFDTFYFGDNIYHAEAALLWVKEELNSYLSSNGVQKSISRVYTFGHSQGGYLVHRLNTMHPVDGVISNAPGPIDLLDRCSGVAQTSTYTCNKIGVGIGTTLSNPDAYDSRSLKSYLSGTLSPTLFTQALDDDAYQVNLMQNVLQPGVSTCTEYGPIEFNYYNTGGHSSFVTNTIQQQDIRDYINSGITGSYTFYNVGIGTTAPTSKLTVDGDVNVSGIVTATNGFISVGNTTPIQISLVGNQLTFTAVGIGSTTLTLA